MRAGSPPNRYPKSLDLPKKRINDDASMHHRRSSSLKDFLADRMPKHDVGPEEQVVYTQYHRRRLEFVMRVAQAQEPRRQAIVLDVGPSALSNLLRTYYATVYTLGFAPEKTWGHDFAISNHIAYDLNDAVKGISIPSDLTFDLILYCETLEHLPTPPGASLVALGERLRPGGIIICQTPNAASLDNRIKMLVGLNPFETIRYDVKNPGHFREYTKRELYEVFEQSGFDVIDHRYKNYFGCYGSSIHRASAHFLSCLSIFFPSFSRGQTLVARRQAHE